VNDGAALLALVVLLCDDYLQLKQTDCHCINQITEQFFQVNLKLPLELQTRICNLAYDVKAITISTSNFDDGLKRMMKRILFPRISVWILKN